MASATRRNRFSSFPQFPPLTSEDPRIPGGPDAPRGNLLTLRNVSFPQASKAKSLSAALVCGWLGVRQPVLFWWLSRVCNTYTHRHTDRNAQTCRHMQTHIHTQTQRYIEIRRHTDVETQGRTNRANMNKVSVLNSGHSTPTYLHQLSQSQFIPTLCQPTLNAAASFMLTSYSEADVDGADLRPLAGGPEMDGKPLVHMQAVAISQHREALIVSLVPEGSSARANINGHRGRPH